jgi:hypothetical protein
MDPITIGAISTIGAGVLGAVASETVKDWLAVRQIGKGAAPNVRGPWKATWYNDGPSSDNPYVEDIVRIETQRGVRIEGYGDVPELGRYTLVGRFNSHGVLTLTYDFREQVNAVVGVVLLRVTPDLKAARGHWHGIARNGDDVGGRVEWSRTV